jgi:hypothetical protein
VQALLLDPRKRPDKLESRIKGINRSEPATILRLRINVASLSLTKAVQQGFELLAIYD